MDTISERDYKTLEDQVLVCELRHEGLSEVVAPLSQLCYLVRNAPVGSV
jgi:hypothetical protein